MAEHAYGHIMAWTSLWILYPIMVSAQPRMDGSQLMTGTMLVFTCISLQHWRHFSIRSLHVLDVLLANLVFSWHLFLGYQTLDAAEWALCLRYALVSATWFLGNELAWHARTRAVACGDDWSYLHIIPHCLFRYYAFGMVMIARGAPWTLWFVGAYVSSIVVLSWTAGRVTTTRRYYPTE